MIGRPLIRFESVTSTQEVAFDLAAKGATEGTTFRAAYQSAGRGRAGRSWTTAPGDALMFSILLRPDVPIACLSPLSILLGEAVASVLVNDLGLQPAVKWPNDVLVGGEKVCGILIQTRSASMHQPLTVVAGIGLNVAAPPDRLPPGATSLASALGQSVDAEPFFTSLLHAIESRYRAFLHGDATRYLKSANELLWLRGEQVSIDDAGRILTGRLDRLADDGALILQTDNGPMRIVSGEMTRGPRRQER